MRLSLRALRPPPDDITPNPNDPASVPPSTVGPDQLVVPGDPHGVTVVGANLPGGPPPTIMPSAWSGWPSDWWPPPWNGQQLQSLTDTAWMCVDRNASTLASMPPYLVGAAPTLDDAWLENPDASIYSSWEEFAKQLFWGYQAVGEAFVLALSRYSTGWPATFRCVPPWLVNVEMAAGYRSYKIGEADVTGEIFHVRYQSSTDDAHGHGPLEVGQYRMVAAQVLTQYGTRLASSGGIPAGVLDYPAGELSAQKAADLKAQWIAARTSSIGEPAVLSGGITWTPTQVNPTEMALVDLLHENERVIAELLGVPPFLIGLPSGDSMTYSNATSLFDYHWRSCLRPMAQTVMAGLSEWLLPRGTRVELNRDAYVQPGPLERAQRDQILNGIRDDQGNPAKTVQEIRDQERLDERFTQGVLRG